MSLSQVTVLISSAGRRVQLIRCFREDAARLGLGLKVLATDANPSASTACREADIAIQVPSAADPRFIGANLDICQQHGVNLLVPTIDPELPLWAPSRHLFQTAGVHVVISSPDVVGIAADKLLSARTLSRIGVAAPHTVWHDDYIKNPECVSWPVVIKPNIGSSSDGVRRPHTLAEATAIGRFGMIVQEQLVGREYTVNLFFDAQSRLRCTVPHERIEVRGGEVSKGVTVRVPVLQDAAVKLSEGLPGIVGPMCFQAIVTESGEFAVFEINARFGGGYPLAHRAGARFTQWLLEEVSGRPLTANNDWKAGVTMLRYDDAVFIND